MSGRGGKQQNSCPHCGLLITGIPSMIMHKKTCLHNPQIYEATRAALTGEDGYIVQYKDYARTHPKGTPSPITLAKYIGDWQAVTAFFDLRDETDREQYKQIDEDDAYAETLRRGEWAQRNPKSYALTITRWQVKPVYCPIRHNYYRLQVAAIR